MAFLAQIEALIKDVPSLSKHVAYEVPYMQSARILPHKGWRVATEHCILVLSCDNGHSIDLLSMRTAASVHATAAQKFNVKDPSDPSKKVPVLDEFTLLHVGFLTKLPLPIGVLIVAAEYARCVDRIRTEGSASVVAGRPGVFPAAVQLVASSTRSNVGSDRQASRRGACAIYGSCSGGKRYW